MATEAQPVGGFQQAESSSELASQWRRLTRAATAVAPVAKANWSTESPVRIGARRYNGATYVIAVNTSTSEATASFSLLGIGGRKLRFFRDGRTVKPLGDLVADKLPGLGVAVYVVPPPGW